MSILKLGTLCVIVGGLPEHIGLVVEVLEHLGHYADREDAYFVRTASGHPFPEIWAIGTPRPTPSNKRITDRRNLRPLVDPKVEAEERTDEHLAPHARRRDVALDLVTEE
jgi:hypothetical protein